MRYFPGYWLCVGAGDYHAQVRSCVPTYACMTNLRNRIARYFGVSMDDHSYLRVTICGKITTVLSLAVDKKGRVMDGCTAFIFNPDADKAYLFVNPKPGNDDPRFVVDMNDAKFADCAAYIKTMVCVLVAHVNTGRHMVVGFHVHSDRINYKTADDQNDGIVKHLTTKYPSDALSKWIDKFSWSYFSYVLCERSETDPRVKITLYHLADPHRDGDLSLEYIFGLDGRICREHILGHYTVREFDELAAAAKAGRRVRA